MNCFKFQPTATFLRQPRMMEAGTSSTHTTEERSAFLIADSAPHPVAIETGQLRESSGLDLSPLCTSPGIKSRETALNCESSPIGADMLMRKAMRSQRPPIAKLFGPDCSSVSPSIFEDAPQGASPPSAVTNVVDDTGVSQLKSRRHSSPTPEFSVDVGAASSGQVASPGPLSWDVVGSINLSLHDGAVLSARSIYNREQFSPSMGIEEHVRGQRLSISQPAESPDPFKPWHPSMTPVVDQAARSSYNHASYSPSMDAASAVPADHAHGGIVLSMSSAYPVPDYSARAVHNEKVISPSMGASEDEREKLNGTARYLSAKSPVSSPFSPEQSMSPQMGVISMAGDSGKPVPRGLSPCESHMSACTTASDTTQCSATPNIDDDSSKPKSFVSKFFDAVFSTVLG